MVARNCWHCNAFASQRLLTDAKRTLDEPCQWYAMFSCDHCGYPSIGMIPRDAETEFASNAEACFKRPHASITWLPLHAIGKEYPGVPTKIESAASEAWACFSIHQNRAAALMARVVVEGTAKQQGFTSGNIYQKIDQMGERGVIPPKIRDAAHEVRLLGNDAAHDILDAQLADDQVADALSFMDVLLEYVYNFDLKLSRFRASRGKSV